MSASNNLKPRMPLIVLVALAWALVVDVPTGIGLGPLSLSGAATLGVAALLVLASPLLVTTKGRNTLPVGADGGHEPYMTGRFDDRALPIAMTLFAVAAIALLALSPNTDGLQNVAVYVLFIASIPITAALCSQGTADATLKWLRRIAITVGAVTAGQSLVGVELYGPRSAALILVVFVGVTLVMPKHNWFDRALPFLLVAACALTLSRTAMFVAAILIPISYLFTAKRNGAVKVLAAAIPMLYLMYVLVTTWAPLRDRFLEGDNAYSAGGLDLNTSGRTVLWEMTTDSWLQSPLLGNGPGSASAMISARFDNIAHPHNEYLRILHDFGIIGFAPFAIGLIMITVAIWKRARQLPGAIHKAAVLSLLGVLAVAFTDNVLIYPFVMVPVGVMVGLSMAHPLPKAATATATRDSVSA
ncbi:O-antigen ligase family protein [Rhodococcus sp. B7740]|uniref:O-antigen ligase family protein n=1 Tax=Rhodococcus sp. B7740 TaxID=1564114 RepID=UPI001185AD0F|nr:O-antigen ligase family protein [Rhodococcus sp. B7740]